MNNYLPQPVHTFKKCTCCEHTWETRDMFLGDPAIETIGYQVNFYNLELGFFLFNHLVSGCSTTMSIEAGQFKHLYDGPIYSIPLNSTDQCLEYCLNKYDLRPCPAECACSYVREILQLIRNWTKNSKN